MSNTKTNGTEVPLNRADEVQDLLTAIQDLIIPFIRGADTDAAVKHTGHGLPIPNSASTASTNGDSSNSTNGTSNGDCTSTRTSLVDSKTPKELEKILSEDLKINEERGGKEGLLEVTKQLLRYSVNTWDQGFMDKLYASTNAVGLVSELLLAVLNTNSHVYQVSPVLTLIEKHTTAHLARLFNYTSPHSGGISQPGGSASNSTAIVIARNTLYPSSKTDGNAGRTFTLFTSAHGHYSMEKAAQMFGIGSKHVISVPVDDAGRMRADELERLVSESEQRGETPFFVNATAGTTVWGAFDPLPALSAVCKKHNLWLHIDGSWGGSVIFNKTLASSPLRLAGSELADSIAITPHKMLGVPMTCSFLLGKDMRNFWSAMTLPAGYLFHSKNEDVSDVYDLAELTPQCGRRADSLKLFLGLQYYGAQHYSDLIQTAFANGNYLLEKLKQNKDFVVVSPEPLPCLQVCFYFARDGKLGDDKERNGEVTATIVEKLIRRGFMTDFAPGEKGKFFRVVVNGGTRRGTLDGLVKAIEEVAGELGY